MKKTIFACMLSSLLLLTSCATIISGSKQNVKFSSTPAAATIFINEVEVGKTPFELKLARKGEHDIQIKLDGYQTYQTSLTRKFNAWYIGNILFGGLIGLVVDPITGAIYNLTPGEINAQLTQGTVFNSTKNGVYIAVVLTSDPSWKKVGQLEKISK